MRQITHPKELVVGEWYWVGRITMVRRKNQQKYRPLLCSESDGIILLDHWCAETLMSLGKQVYGPIPKPNTGALKTPEENK